MNRNRARALGLAGALAFSLVAWFIIIWVALHAL